MEYEILEKYKDSDGRLIIIKCKFENTNYIISNCYAPTQQYKNYQINFIQLARNYLSSVETNALLESLNLSDVWRTQNPTTKRYTWHSRGKSSQLDYFYISDHLLNDVNSCQINPGLHSDHSILNLELNTNTLNRGKGLWKFNLKLLKDQEYINIVKNTVRTSIIEFKHHDDKGLVWELTKLKIRSATIPYCVKKINKKEQLHLNLT